jgi:hypothetical protein
VTRTQRWAAAISADTKGATGQRSGRGDDHFMPRATRCGFSVSTLNAAAVTQVVPQHQCSMAAAKRHGKYRLQARRDTRSIRCGPP